MRIPLSTYRLQFGSGFGFQQARELVPYLHQLGITDVYASPIFQAHSDSVQRLRHRRPHAPEPGAWIVGRLYRFLRRAEAARHGSVLDIVPNHMSDAASNLWWRDVLENGPSSPYAYYFDIEWDPPSRSRGEKMLWPILGAPYADALERQELTLTFSEEGFAIRYFERTLPIDPATYGLILSHVPEAAELAELIDSLPPSAATDPEAVSLRRSQTRN